MRINKRYSQKASAWIFLIKFSQPSLRKGTEVFLENLYVDIKVARLDFLGGYLPRLSINYVAMSKDREKRLPQLYYIKMKISYDLGFIAIGVAMAT